jgi:hypothetical protein
MYVYNYRIFDHYDRRVVSLAVLADDDPNWRPRSYRDELWGWSLRMDFPPVKLLDYAGHEAELEADPNPFAHVVLAHLKALETRRDPEGRRAWKFRLVRGLYERGFQAEDVRRLFRLVDWLMSLPPGLNRRFWQDIMTYQKERSMPFLTTPERIAMWDTMQLWIEDALRLKFGEEGLRLMPEIKVIDDADKYRAIHQSIVTATSLDEVRRVCAEVAAPGDARRKKQGGSGKRRST